MLRGTHVLRHFPAIVVLVGLATACGSSTTPAALATTPLTLTIPARFTVPPIVTAVGSGTTLPTATVGATPLSVGSAVTTPPPQPTEAMTAPVAGPWINATDGLVGVESECGNMALVSARPDQDVMIASVALQGLWSADPADHWTKLGTAPGSATIVNRGSRIVYDPDHPGTYWESGIYNGGGVYRTDDNGATFRQLGNVSHIEAVSVDLSDPARKTLLATQHEMATVYRSTDGGNTWVDITATLPSDIGFSTGPLVINAQTFLLGTSHSVGSGVFRSTDGGASWSKVYTTGAAASPLIAKSDGAIYWLLDKSQGMIKSVDGGVTWTIVTPPGLTSPSALQLLELPDGRLATVGGNIIIVSADHGASWQSIGPATPFSPTGVAYSAFRKAFYIWHFDCDFSTKDPIQPDSIMRLDIGGSTP